MTTIERDNIIADINNGDESAFKEFYKRNAPSLRYFASKYLEEDFLIDDIIQDSFVTFWHNCQNFNSLSAARAYLYKVVKNSCLNLLRHKTVESKYSEAIIKEDNSETFLDNILEAEIFDLVLKFFEELPPECKRVYKLSLGGMSHGDISQKLGISINTVKKHKNNANHFIRERINKILSLLLFVSV